MLLITCGTQNDLNQIHALLLYGNSYSKCFGVGGAVKDSSKLAVATMLAMTAVNDLMPGIEQEIDRSMPKEKTCLNCGETYLHKKKFCSAECCKSYGAKTQQQRGN